MVLAAVAVSTLCLEAWSRPTMALPNEFESDVGGVLTDPTVVKGDEIDDEEDEVDGGDVGELA